jgi:hypothetical protein
MITDTQVFESIIPQASATIPHATERRRSFRRPLGTIATISRIIDGQEHNRLHVLVTNRSEEGVGLRCPIGLVESGIYRLQIGCELGDSALIQIRTSRARFDQSFDIGAVEI